MFLRIKLFEKNVLWEIENIKGIALEFVIIFIFNETYKKITKIQNSFFEF